MSGSFPLLVDRGIHPHEVGQPTDKILLLLPDAGTDRVVAIGIRGVAPKCRGRPESSGEVAHANLEWISTSILEERRAYPRPATRLLPPSSRRYTGWKAS